MAIYGSRVRMRSGHNPGYVYVLVAAHGGIKIGASTDPERRVRTINAGKTIKARLVHSRLFRDYMVAESAAHSEMDAWHLSGEWFSCPIEVAISTVDSLVEVEPACEAAA